MSATITAQDVNKLRQMTGVGIMDCKKALVEADGDFEKAVDILRKKGQKVSASRAGRDAAEGVIAATTSGDGKNGVVIELNCETDFVAKNADFVAFAEKIADIALQNNPASVEELKGLEVDGKKIADALIEQTGVIGEKIEVSKYEAISAEKVVAYIHGNYRLGVLVGLSADAAGLEEAGKDVAMQIAAMNPIAIDKDGVDQETVDREIAIAKEQIIAEGKPAEMAEKIAQGRLNKFFKEYTLLNQEFVKDSSKTISKMLNDTEAGLTVLSFKRIALGA